MKKTATVAAQGFGPAARSKVKMLYESSSEESSEEEEEVIQSIHIDNQSPQQDMLKKFKRVLDEHTQMINRYEEQANDAVVDSWNQSAYNEGNHIEISIQDDESMPGLFEMLECENQFTTKVMATFTILFQQCDRVKHEESSTYFDPILLLGQGVFESDDSAEPDVDQQVCEVQFSRMMGVLNPLYDHAKKINLLAKSLFSQIISLFKKYDGGATDAQKHTHQVFKNLNCFFIYDKIGEVLSTNLIIDHLVNDNAHLAKYMDLFDKMMRLIGSDSKKFAVSDAQVKKIKKRLKKLYENLLSCSLFENSIQSLITVLKQEFKGIQKFKDFQAKYLQYLKIKITNVMNQQMGQRQQLSSKSTISLLINFAIFTRLFEQQDKNLFKKIWSIQKIQPVVNLHSRVGMLIGKFLEQHSGFNKLPRADPKDLSSFFSEALEKRQNGFAQAVDYNCQLTLSWLSQFNSNTLLKISTTNKSQLFAKLRFQIKLLKNGILIAQQNRINIETILLMRRILQDDNPPDKIQMAIARVVALLSMIRMEYKKKSTVISQWMIYINHIMKKLIQDLLTNARFLLDRGKKTPAQTFLHNTMKILQNNLGAPMSKTRWNIILVCCDFLCTIKGVLKEPEIEDLISLLHTLDLMMRWEEMIQMETNCHFMYYLRHRIPDIFSTIVRVCPASDFNLLLQYFVHGLRDPIDLLLSAKHLLNPRTLAQEFIQNCKESFEKNVIEYIWKEIDADLRLNYHTVHVQGMRQANPVRDVAQVGDYGSSGTALASTGSVDMSNSSGNPSSVSTAITADLARFIRERIAMVQLFDERIDIKDRVRRQLNKNYHMLTAMTPNDYKTYDQMRQLAQTKFGIKLAEIYLPPQTIDQGFDVLRLTRQIQAFVAKYYYNLHTHTFIEITQQTKQIKAISVSQFTHSLKTHGLGVLTATINAVFQLLLKKFNVFSSFMYQDLINSPLFLQQRAFRQNREQYDNKFPSARAQKLKAELLKIGKHKDGTTYFDKFRDLITQMGNAIGYMRLVRSASMGYCAQMKQHLPNKEELKVQKIDNEDENAGVEKETEYEPLNFGEIIDILKMDDHVTQTGQLLDQTMNVTLEHSVQSADYLKLLIKVMEDALKQMDFNHLRVFFLIVPPLSIGHIDKVCMAKQKLFKRNMIDAFISDDGFALGVAFILKLLDQNEAFNSLHWFDSLEEKFQNDKRKLMENKVQRGKKDEQFEEQVSLKRINTQDREFKWLKYSFTAGQIFFKDI